MNPFAIGIDLGGTAIKLAAFDMDTGRTLEMLNVPTRDGETIGSQPAFAIAAVDAMAEIERTLGASASAIGVSAPGLANREGSAIDYMPGRLDGLEGLDWGRLFDRCGEVPVLNDGHAALLGEIWQGAAKDMRDVVMLTLGTGVGGAIVSGGRLLTGHIGRAGHLGHMSIDFRGKGDICGTPGSIEDAIGFCTLEERCGGRFDSTTALLEAAADGDVEAEEIWQTSVRALAAAIASLANILDPEAVVIGGGIANAGDALFNPLAVSLDAFEWRPDGHRVQILPAQLGDLAGATGAAYRAIRRTQS